MNWLKTNWKALIPLATVLAGIIGAAIGVKLSIKADPNATQPEVIFVVPDGPLDNNPPLFAAGRSDGVHPVFFRLIRVKATIQLAREKNISLRDASAKIRQVTDEQILTAMADAKVPVKEIGDGKFLQNILDWLSDPANQEKIMAIIRFMLTLVPLFIHHDCPPDWGASLTAWYC